MATATLPKHSSLSVKAAIFLLAIAVLLWLAIGAHDIAASTTATGALIYLQDAQATSATYSGSSAAVQPLTDGQATPLSLADGDFNEDGVEDVAAGYSAPDGSGIIALYPGNAIALAPQSTAALQAIGQEQFPSPFSASAVVSQIPKPPDFLAAGRYAGTDHQDLIAAAQGDTTLYLLPGKGKSQFGVAQTIALPGSIVALAAGRFGNQSRFTSLLVGINGPQPAVLLFTGSEKGLTLAATYPVSAPPTSLSFGDIDGDLLPDAVITAGGQVEVIHSAQAANPKFEILSLPLSASAAIVGSFVHDRAWREQLAVLTTDGSVDIIAHGGFDPRGWTRTEILAMWDARIHHHPNPYARSTAPTYDGWGIIETLASVAPFNATGHIPLLSKARISGHSAEDVMVVNPDAGQMTLISHNNVPSGSSSFLPAQLSTRAYSTAIPVAVLPFRVNVDARPGMVLLNQGQAGLYAMMPLPDPTFFVNRIDDPPPGTPSTNCNNVNATDTSSSCSLRQAIMKANAASGQDTVVIPAGVFQLTIPSNGTFDASSGHLDINDGVNIIGQGAGNTIIQATNGDQIFSILDLDPTAPDPGTQGPGIPVSISGVTLSGGNGSSALLGGGSIAWDAGTDGGGTLSLNSVVVTGNAAPSGGGIVLFDISQIADTGGNPNGFGVTISNSVISSNKAQFTGGGISTNGPIALLLANTQVVNNQVLDTNPGDGSLQQGGGLFLSVFTPAPAVEIHSGSLISGNIAGAAGSGQGGGIWTTQAMVIDQGTEISSNIAGGAGGGLWSGLSNSVDAVNITASTIINNQAGANGGGVQLDSTNAGAFTAHFNRIVGNTSGAGGNGINNAGPPSANVDHNWWGCNAGPTVTASGCDLVQGVSPAGNITLSFVPDASTIVVGASTQFTANLQDANPQLASNLDAFVNKGISIQNPVNGTLSGVQTAIQSNGSATATFTANAIGTGSVQVAFDHQSLTASIQIQDFSLTATPALQSVNSGSASTVTYTGKITPASGFAGIVQLSCSEVPQTGITVTCPSSVTVTAGQIASFSTTATTTVSTAPASYLITVSATATSAGSTGSDVHTATVTLAVTNFTVSPAASTLTVNAGSSASVNDILTLTSLGGFSGAATISCTAPANQGIAVSCAPSTVSVPVGGSTTSTLTVSTSASTPAGQYALSVTATGGGITAVATINLVVADFAVTVAPATQTINATGAASFQVTISTTTGFAGSITMTCGATGSGITFTGCPPQVSLTPASGSASASTTFTINANTTSATSGNNTVTVAGTSGAVRRSATAQLVSSNFTLTADTTTQTINVGAAAAKSFTITTSPVANYSGTVCLTATVAPSVSNAPIATLTPACIPSSGSSTLQVTASAATPAQSYTVTITGTSTISGTSINITQSINVSFVVADFALAVAPSSLTANAGSTTNPATITGTSSSGFNGPVSFSPSDVTGLPAGATIAFSNTPITVAPGSTTNVTAASITTSATTAAGNYQITIIGRSGSASHSVQVTLLVAGFSLGSSSATTQTITAGQCFTFNLFGQSQNGFAGIVNWTSSVAPAGLTPQPGSGQITLASNGQTTFSVQVCTSVFSIPGTYTLSISGGNGSITQNVPPLTLIVNAPPPDFQLSLGPTPVTTLPGNFVELCASTFPIGGFNSSVTATATSSPAGLPINIVPITCGLGLNILPPTNIPLGTYTVTVTVSGGGVTHQASAQVNVVAPDFTFTGGGTQTINAGTSTTFPYVASNINVSSVNVVPTMTFSVTGLPAGATFTLSPSSFPDLGPGPVNGTLTINTASSTPGGSYPITITASTPTALGGTVTHSVTAVLNVVAPDFALSLSGAQTVTQGGTASFGYAVSNLTNVTSIAVSQSGIPANTTVSMAPLQFSASGSGTLTIGTSTATTAGTYTVTITAIGSNNVGGLVVHTASATLTINHVPDFTISVGTSSAINPGDTATYGVNVGFLGNFFGSVGVSVSGVPAGASAILVPGSFFGPGPATLTVNTSTSIAPGTYTITLTGGGAGMTHTANAILTVLNPNPPPPRGGGCTGPRCLPPD